MEINKFIQDALKDGSIEKVGKGIEQLVIMMINAIGMMEQRHLELTQKIESLEEDMNVIKDFLLSKPVPLPGSTQLTTSPPSSPEPLPSSGSATSPPDKPAPPEVAPAVITNIAQSPQTQPDIIVDRPTLPPTEEDIMEFRKKLLKPTPKHEKPPPQPVSIRAALMQEMKEYFGSAMKKVDKDKTQAD